MPALLARAFLFGSRARGEARPDSDLDVLFIFRELPPDREPQAGMAEELAHAVARVTGVPLEVWSVAMCDLQRGWRTPMLVDALEDGIPLWPPAAPPLHLSFTAADASRCVAALLQRVAEGSEEVRVLRARGAGPSAARRVRDDLVRLATAALLLNGITRPRRGDAVRAARALPGFAPIFREHPAVARWAETAFGPPGWEDDASVPPPPGGLPAAAALLMDLRVAVRAVSRGAALPAFEGVSTGSTPAVPNPNAA